MREKGIRYNKLLWIAVVLSVVDIIVAGIGFLTEGPVADKIFFVTVIIMLAVTEEFSADLTTIIALPLPTAFTFPFSSSVFMINLFRPRYISRVPSSS